MGEEKKKKIALSCLTKASTPFNGILTWNELFFVNVTIFNTFPKRWNIWYRISNDTGYNSDSTITLSTVFGPPGMPWIPCVVCSAKGSGEPDAGDCVKSYSGETRTELVE